MLPLRFVTTLHFDETTWQVNSSQISVVDESWCWHLNPPTIESQQMVRIDEKLPQTRQPNKEFTQ